MTDDRYALRSRQDVEGMGGSYQQHQPTSLCPGSATIVSSYPISGTSILSWQKSSTAKIPSLGASSRPPSNRTARSVNISIKLPPTSASTISFWEWVASFAALTPWLEKLSLDPQKATKLAMELHAHWVHAYKFISARHALQTLANSHCQGQELGTASHPPNTH